MSGTGVAFQQIPQNFIPPLFYVEFNNTLAGEVGNAEQPALIIGQATVAGLAEVPVLVPSVAFAMAMFGPNSQLARMADAYFKNDSIGPLYALPLEDASGAAAAAGAVAFTGTATGAGSIFVYVNGRLIQVGVNVGDTAAVIAGNVAAAINALVLMPVSAVATAGSVALTAVNKGLQGNNINLGLNLLGVVGGQVLPAGVTCTITAMANGALDPDLASVAAAIGDQPFDFILHPYGESTQIGETTALMNDTSGRWAWNRQDYGGVFTATPGTISSLLTLGNTLNDQHTEVVGLVGYPPDPAYFIAAWGGALAVSLRNLPSQPLQSLDVEGVLGAQRANWLTLAQENTLYAAGIALPRSDQYGNVTVGQAVTTYKTNVYGQPDESYRYVSTLFTLMSITRTMKAALVTKFGRAIYVPNGTRTNPNVPAVTNNDIMAEIAAQYNLMQAQGLVVNAAAMLAATSVTADPNNPNRANIIWRPELANGLTMMAMINQFVLNPAAAA
jgi:phage tail sheath gpL-like